METSIVTAIIAATATVLASLLTVRANRSRIFSPYKKEFMEALVFNFLAPMDKIMTFHAAQDWSDIRFDLKYLIDTNYALVPPQILSECTPLLSSEEIADEQFHKLRTIVASFYNWTKREIGCPYDHSKLKKEYVPVDEMLEKMKILFAVLVVFATIFFAVLFLFNAIPENRVEEIKRGIIINLILWSLYFGWIFLIGMFRKK